jgi:arylsulfatase A
MRVGDWKAIRLQPGKPLELYNLAKDIAEKENVAAANPVVVARIEKLMAAAHVDSADFPLVVAKKNTK